MPSEPELPRAEAAPVDPPWPQPPAALLIKALDDTREDPLGGIDLNDVLKLQQSTGRELHQRVLDTVAAAEAAEDHLHTVLNVLEACTGPGGVAELHEALFELVSATDYAALWPSSAEEAKRTVALRHAAAYLVAALQATNGTREQVQQELQALEQYLKGRIRETAGNPLAIRYGALYMEVEHAISKQRLV